jgi:hypothetical protein
VNGPIETDADAMLWGEEAAVQERLVNILVDQVVLQTRGVPFPIRYYALRMAQAEKGFTNEELGRMLSAAIIALAVEREKRHE